jgi:hypothetical protein
MRTRGLALCAALLAISVPSIVLVSREDERRDRRIERRSSGRPTSWIADSPESVSPVPRSEDRSSPSARGALAPPCDAADPAGGVGCVPLDPKTGAPYSMERMAELEAIRAGCRKARRCGRNNRALPAILDQAEYTKRAAIAARTTWLRGLIDDGTATEDDIDEYYSYVNQTNHHKRQIVEFLLESRGPDASLEAARKELASVDEELHLAKRLDRRRAGLSIDLEEQHEAERGREYDLARLHTLRGTRP